MYLIICYDITSNRRRARLHKHLKAYLYPVQKSVFEGPLPAPEYTTLLSTIQQTISMEEDTVRIYHLTQARADLTQLLGRSPKIPEYPEDIII